MDSSLRSARIVVPVLLSLVQVRTVVDFGCGVGAWLKAFEENGVSDYLGLDGDYISPDQMLVNPSSFRPTDLRNLPRLGRAFDMAVCLEVGEHLPARTASHLVARLVEAAPHVLFSAAPPGQGGTHHINEQWPHFWRRLFSAHNYERLDPIRPQIWRSPEVQWWYKQNIYLYSRSDVIAGDKGLALERELATHSPFELLHSDVFGQLTTVSGLARALPPAIRRSLRRLFRLKRCE
jgi:hypothetical protein